MEKPAVKNPPLYCVLNLDIKTQTYLLELIYCIEHGTKLDVMKQTTTCCCQIVHL